eukprot:681282-Rhodomonas_salina.1
MAWPSTSCKPALTSARVAAPPPNSSASVGGSVGGSVQGSVGRSVGGSVGGSVEGSVGDSACRASVR